MARGLLGQIRSSVSRAASPALWLKTRVARVATARKSISLALQGGGAHGAFTWGVLDQLLSHPEIRIANISGASSGAINAVMLADGLARGGPEEARRRLADFWRAASFDGSLPEPLRGVVERLFSFVPQPGSETPWFGALSGLLSPYEFNPLNINPLKELIERFVDFPMIRQGQRELFISATSVRTGQPRVFTRAEMTAEVVMASACLPLIFHAVEIGHEPYWDGGYSGNPSILPFLQKDDAGDILIIQINPLMRRKVPLTTAAIKARINEITFNAPLLAELRTIELTGSRVRLHRIVMDEQGETSDAQTKSNNDYDLFEMLHERGRDAAKRFLAAHARDIGHRSTVNSGTIVTAHADVA